MRAWSIAAVLLFGACANRATLGPQGSMPSVDVAQAALRGGSPQIALHIDDAILANDPHNLAALLNRGETLTALQQFDAATTAYAAALEADPQSVAAHIGLGRLRLRADPAAAETLFLDALQRDPRNAAALNNLGIARDLLGRHQDAQVAYRQAMGIDTTMTGVQVNLALSLAMAGRAEDAAPLLRPLASDPNAPRKLRHDMAAVLAMAGDRVAAQRILAQDLPPEDVDRALAIFVAAISPTGAGHAGDAPVVAVASPSDDGTGGGQRLGGVMVELGSAASSGLAEAVWQKLRRLLPDMLADHQPVLLRSENAGVAVWRLRTGGFTGPQEAEDFCRAVKARRAECTISGA